jgi:hypothetical protein
MKSLAFILPLIAVAIASPVNSPTDPKPRLCTKICAPSAEVLNCGEGWYPWNFEGGVSGLSYSNFSSVVSTLGGRIDCLVELPSNDALLTLRSLVGLVVRGRRRIIEL